MSDSQTLQALFTETEMSDSQTLQALFTETEMSRLTNTSGIIH